MSPSPSCPLILVLTLFIYAGLSPGMAADANPAAAPETGSSVEPVQANLASAFRLFGQGKEDEALAVVNSILQADAQNVAALILRGAIYTKKQQWDLAEKDYQAGLQIDPKSVDVRFAMADLKFQQKKFDEARAAFVAIPASKDDDVTDLVAYKIFLCDLLGGREDMAAKELAVFNATASRASYYFGNAAWALVHKKPEDARGWLMSAANIYPTRKHLMYMAILKDMGYLPLPPPPAKP